MTSSRRKLAPYRASLAGTLLAAREAVMGPIRPMLRDAGVTEQQWRVLRVLDDQGQMEPTALAEAALLYAPSVARIVRDLVERGMVVRAPHGADRRRAILTLSPTGAELMHRTSELTMVKLDDYADRFGRERLLQLVAELRALIDAIGPGQPLADGSEA